RHRAVHAVAAVAGRAAGGRTRALERAGAGAEDRATWAGGFLRPPPLAARAAGAGADHRALLVEQGAENAWPGPRPAAAAAHARHAPGRRCAGDDAGRLRAR